MDSKKKPAQLEIECLMELERDGLYIQHIENPTPLMILTAISGTPEAILHVQDPTLMYWKLAVIKKPTLLQEANRRLAPNLFFELLNSIPNGLKYLNQSDQNYRMCRQLIHLNPKNEIYSVYHQDS